MALANSCYLQQLRVFVSEIISSQKILDEFELKEYKVGIIYIYLISIVN